MTRFRERNLPVVGLISLLVIIALVVGALNFSRLPLAQTGTTQAAYFDDAGGLAVGDVVTVHGVKVGTITAMRLDHYGTGPTPVPVVRVSFQVQGGLRLGAATTASAKVLSPIGTEYLELAPAGSSPLHGPIPPGQTSIPYNLVTDLSKLGRQIEGYDIPTLERALETGADSISGTPASDARAAFAGLARFSEVLGNDQGSLAAIVTQGAALSKVLADRSGQLMNLVSESNAVLGVLSTRQAAIKQLLDATAALSTQITHILNYNQAQLQPLLTSLKTVSQVLAQDSTSIGNALPVLAAFGRYAANSTGSGSFADVAVPTLLLPDNLLVQCAAAGAYPSSNSQVGCRP